MIRKITEVRKIAVKIHPRLTPQMHLTNRRMLMKKVIRVSIMLLNHKSLQIMEVRISDTSKGSKKAAGAT